MDAQSRIDTYRESLRLIYGGDTPNLTGLRAKIRELHDAAEASEVAITNSSFEGEQSAGQLVLEPLAKLNAAISLLRELDPDNVPDAQPSVFHADFRGGALET